MWFSALFIYSFPILWNRPNPLITWWSYIFWTQTDDIYNKILVYILRWPICTKDILDFILHIPDLKKHIRNYISDFKFLFSYFKYNVCISNFKCVLIIIGYQFPSMVLRIIFFKWNINAHFGCYVPCYK